MATKIAILAHHGIKQSALTMKLVQENVLLMVLIQLICKILMVLKQMAIHLT